MKYVWLQNRLHQYVKEEKFPMKDLYDYNSFYARLYPLMPFPSKKFKAIWDEKFSDFYLKIRIIEYVLYSSIVLFFAAIVIQNL